MAGAVGGELPECPDNVILDRKPGPHDTSLTSIFSQTRAELCRHILARLLLVYGEVFLAHHELQVVYDDVIDVVHVDSMLHGVQHCPIKTVGKRVRATAVLIIQ